MNHCAGRTLPHAAFFEALGDLNESDADWQPLHAGLQTLRLVDAWLAQDPEDIHAGPADVTWQLRSVRAAVEAVATTILSRTILLGIVQTLDTASERSAAAVTPRLMAYGRSLDYDARFAVAADVYRSVVHYASKETDPELALDARVRLGHCLRKLDDWAGADTMYTEASALAATHRDVASAVHARIGLAAVAFARGNLPGAASMLDGIIADTESPDLNDVRAMALHDRATVAYRRAQYSEAARLAYGALQLTRSLTARDRVLADLANSFTQLGMLDAARDGFLVLAATAQEQVVRWNAMINLLEVSALQTNEPVFEHYRRELLGERMPPSLKAQYHYYTAFGYQALTKPAAAERSLEKASELAQAHHCNQLLFQIDELRSAIKRGQSTRPTTPFETPSELREAREAVSDMRQLVGI